MPSLHGRTRLGSIQLDWVSTGHEGHSDIAASIGNDVWIVLTWMNKFGAQLWLTKRPTPPACLASMAHFAWYLQGLQADRGLHGDPQNEREVGVTHDVSGGTYTCKAAGCWHTLQEPRHRGLRRGRDGKPVATALQAAWFHSTSSTASPIGAALGHPHVVLVHVGARPQVQCVCGIVQPLSIPHAHHLNEGQEAAQ